MNNKLEQQCNGSICPTVTYQDINVCVPVTIKAWAEGGNIEIECLGKPIIDSKCHDYPDRPNSTCKFTISQKLRVTIPVMFDAKAEIGKSSIECAGQKEEKNYHYSKIRNCESESISWTHKS